MTERELFVAALHLQGEARIAFLDLACADATRRARIDSLLLEHDRLGSFLEPPEGATLAHPAPDATIDHPAGMPGKLIGGKYKLMELIGEGGMGSVWRAQQSEPVKRFVAVKLIKSGMDSKAVLARFEAERQALAVMDHPNIARILDGGVTEAGSPYFVMELVKGVPITEFCDARKLTPRQRLELFVPVCQAIQHAHQKGVIHRDIKPSNVLIALYDDRPVPKVIDFGIAKATGQALTDASYHTAFGGVVGTPEYMSPEQASLNNLDIDTRSDVYSLGVLLYELLAGSPPFRTDELKKAGMLEILRVVREEEPPRPSARLSTANALPSLSASRSTEPKKLTGLLRNELDWVVMKALEKDRARRYESANGFAADVQRYLTGDAVQAHPPSAAYRMRKFVRRHKGRVLAAGLLAVALVAGLASTTWQAVRATRAEEAARGEQTKTADALVVADEQRRKAETQAASLAVDIDLKYCEDGEVPLGLLRLARTLPTIPEHAKELRECVALNILAWGQQLCPPNPLTDLQKYDASSSVQSPDGRTVMTSGHDGTVRLWDSPSGKQRSILGEPRPDKEGYSIQFSGDGHTAIIIRGSFQSNPWGGHLEFVRGDDRIVQLWDVDTGRLRGRTAQHPGAIISARLSDNGALLATACTLSKVAWSGTGKVFLWNAKTGQLLRTVDVTGTYPHSAVSPDGRSVLIAQREKVSVWIPEEGSPPRLLIAQREKVVEEVPQMGEPGGGPGGVPGTSSGSFMAAFSPSGRFAVTISSDAIRWWNTENWRIHQEAAGMTGSFYEASQSDPPRFLREDIVILQMIGGMGWGVGEVAVVRNLPNPIFGKNAGPLSDRSAAPILASSNGSLLACDVNEVYETRNGQRLTLPHGRRFHPELSQFSEDGKYTVFPGAFVVDLLVEKKIGGNPDRRLLTKQNAAIDADLLQKWCHVITRGRLDEAGRFSKIDEAEWEKLRQELAHALDENANAQVLRSAVTDRLHWLRLEIEGTSVRDPMTGIMKPSLPLLDRLVAAEPTGTSYDRRAQVHFKRGQWYEVIRDELEAARLLGDRYRRNRDNTPTARMLFDGLALAPGRPREQYELALRWVEANKVVGQLISAQNPGSLPAPPRDVIGLIQFRLGRYGDALTTLRKNDVPKLSKAAGMLMSPWNLLAAFEHNDPSPGGRGPGDPIAPPGPFVPFWGRVTVSQFTFEPMDLALRAMCHHHLGQPKEAGAYLRRTRELLGKEGGSAEQRALLREAETLIEGKARP